MSELILASASPRRLTLLQQLGVQPTVAPVDLDERQRPHEDAESLCMRLARDKARAGWHRQLGARRPTLGADTLVVLDGACLGKPDSMEHAVEMLLRLSGRTHRVYTAVCGIDARHCLTRLSISEVTFARIQAAQAQAYARSGEPLDKAGGYAIQGRAAAWIRGMRGSHSGIVGLPLYQTAQILGKLDIMTEV